jgi:dephospho-CoA kinase
MPRKKKIIIGLVSLMSAGKGTIACYLQKEYGASTFRFSTIIRAVLDILYLPHTRQNMSLLSTILRKNFSEDLFARVITENVKNDQNNIIVVEGIRRMADIKYLTGLDNFILTKVVVDAKKRYERLTKRTENPGDAKKTYKDFLADHKLETELQIPQVMETAAETINNNGNLEDLYKQVDLLIAKYREEKK